ncbi:hypothetical protein [Actinomadura mexicana]|uniref:Uncharacterized protein n=1 Tax=Actinomadura mexicana TaxID=134959 RepID=A0A238VNI9_9ACTN|nr:hypothetical protein [Actinomadura mexicana]SNR35049.1 hypothetical protein SAMN06265355_10215 [Actinomadura mexicana]
MATNENAPGGETGGVKDEQLTGGYVETTIPRQHVDELLALATAAAEMVDDIQGQQRRESAAFGEGYALGLAAGVDVGRDQAETDMTEAWRPVAESVRRLGRTLTFEEIERRRWDGRREDFGLPRPGDYTGGPVDWETGRPLGRGTAA